MQLPFVLALMAGVAGWCWCEKVPANYNLSHELRQHERSVHVLCANARTHSTLSSIPTDPTQDSKPRRFVVASRQSGVCVCSTGRDTTLHYVHLLEYPIFPDCGLLMPLSDEQRELNVMQNMDLVVPCRANGTGVNLSLESTRDCALGLLSMQHVPDKGFVVSSVQIGFSGAWQCVARRGNCSHSETLHVRVIPIKGGKNLESGASNGLLVGALIAVSLLLLLSISYLTYHFVQSKRHVTMTRLSRNDVRLFLKGAVETINPELGIDQQADLLPYNAHYEFLRENLKLGKQLASGEFGRVLKGQARGPLPGTTEANLLSARAKQEKLTTVAVKMLRPQSEVSHLKALMTELKILIHVGKHLNVVNLLGACTTNLANNGLLVIVEYCRFGNVHSFLLRIRDQFVDQLDHSRGVFNFAIGASSDHMDAITFQKLSSSPETGEAGMMEEEAAIALYDMGTSLIIKNEKEKVERTSVMEMMAHAQQGDFRAGEVPCVSTKDLVCWSYQVARGMEHLASRKVVHADLAARNLLLADNNVIKICDFGISSNIYRHASYRKKSTSPLPVRWMAPESLQDRVFSTRSDVWSFGVVLWELFSLARTPYPGISQDEMFVTRIKEGYRMDKPQYSTEEIYRLMKSCWQAMPAYRPNFTQLAKKLGDMLEEKSKKLYLELG